MKKRNLLPGLALAALLALGFAGTAHANNYTGNCANYPNLTGGGTFDGNGNVDITDSSCTLPQAVTATGHVHINATGAISSSSNIQGNGEVTLSGTSVNVKDVVSTGNRLKITATSGDLETQAVTANGEYIQVLAPAGKITINGVVTGTNLVEIFKARDDVGLKGGAMNNGGDVRIFAHTSGSSGSAFAIGSSSGNGATFIKTNGVTSGTIYISNGTSTGGINYSGSDKLQVRATGGQAGTIVLDGGSSNKITLTDDMNADGASGQSSGGILLFAPEVISNGATLSANSPGHHVGNISLTTNKVTVNSGGLTLNINGDGSFPDFVNLSITPVDSWTVTGSDNPAAFVTYGSFTSSSNSLEISGGGTLTINADGNGNGLKIWGNSLTLKPATTAISQQGGWNGVSILAWDGASTRSTLTLGGNIAVHENTTSTGQGRNQIQVDGTSIVQVFSGVVQLDGSGKNDGDGSDVYVTPNAGSLRLGGIGGNNITLTADGGPTGGKGGNITAGTGGTLTLSLDDGAAMDVSGLGGNGEGGTITVDADKVNTTGIGSAFIYADSHGSGFAGTVYLLHRSDSTDMVLNNVLISTSGAADGDGSGHDITITSASGISLDGTQLRSNGSGTGNAFGGTINIYSSAQIHPDTATIVATGAENGDGGAVVISNAASFDVNKVILVDGGSSLSPTHFDGSISLNGPTCQQWKTGYSPWPKTYWSCAHTTPDGFDSEPADFAGGTLLNNLSTLDGKAQLYVFASIDDLNAFFVAAGAPNFNGGTFRAGTADPTATIYSSIVYEANTSHLDATTAHELGHALDLALGGTFAQSASSSTYDTAWAKRDFFYLDYTDLAGLNRRDPCVATTVPAPFANFAAICPGGTVDPNYSTMRNSQILQQLSLDATYIFTRNQLDLSWGELYANQFALAAYENGLPLANRHYTNADAVIAAGYFKCTAAWAAAVFGGTSTPPASPTGQSCGVDVPNSYEPG